MAIAERQKRILKFAIAGLLYGLVLAAFGLIDFSAQYSSCFLYGISSSPFNIQRGAAGFGALPVFWALVGILLSVADQFHAKILFFFLMIAHYFGLGWLIPLGRVCSDWIYSSEMLGSIHLVIAVGLAVYFTGQFFIWRSFVKRTASQFLAE